MDKKVLIVLGIMCCAIIATFLIIKNNNNNPNNNAKVTDEEEVITEYKKLSCTEEGHDDIKEILYAYSYGNKKLRTIFKITTYIDEETAKKVTEGVTLKEKGYECILNNDKVECEFDVKTLSNDVKTKYDLVDNYNDDYDGLKKYMTNEKGLSCID